MPPFFHWRSSVHAAIGANSDDDRIATHAVTVGANGDDTVSIPDFDGDGTVGFSDFISFASKFGTQRGDAAFDARFDLDGDDEIGFSDFLAFASQFGKTVEPTPPPSSPDLIVESPSVSDSTLTPGQSFTLSATVRNQGAGAAAAASLRYYRSTNRTISIQDSLVGSDAVSSLAAFWRQCRVDQPGPPRRVRAPTTTAFVWRALQARAIPETTAPAPAW